jgi:hypothetical protein
MHDRLLLLFAAAWLAGCVTINIYFPAAAAEKAADKIIDEVWQIQKDRDAAVKPAPAAPKP